MKFSALKVLTQGLTGNKGWKPHWRDPDPKSEYDIVIIGGGGEGDTAKAGKGTDECDGETEKGCEGDPPVWDVEQFEADTLLIRRLWSDWSDSTRASRSEMIAVATGNSHPDLGFTEGYFDACIVGPPLQWEEARVRMDSVVRSPGWKVLGIGSRIDGLVPRGRLYAYDLDLTSGGPGRSPASGTFTLHAAVIGSGASAQAFIFRECA